MAAPRVTLFLTSIQQRSRGWTGRKYRLSSLRYHPVGIRTQPTSGTRSIPLGHLPVWYESFQMQPNIVF